MDYGRGFLLGLIIVAILAGILLFRDLWSPAVEPSPETVMGPPEATLPPEPEETLEPLHPIEPIEARSEGGELIPLPPLEESDEYFRLALVDILGEPIDTMLMSDLLIERTVGSTDNLARNRVPEKIRPIKRLSGNFVVDGTGGDVGFMLSPRNYERYDGVVALLEGADVVDLVDTYRRFYPLLEEAYRALGYPDAHFNDRVVEVIDLLLATPRPDQPIELVRESVLYQFRDPELEALTAGQKMMIRMGPDNADRVAAVLEAIRTEISQPD